VASLLYSLREAGAQEQITALASQAAARAGCSTLKWIWI
jgi:hypothetical protein